MAINKIILNDVEIELSDEQARRIIGSGNLSTVAQNLVGGVNEINAKVGNGVLTTNNKALIGGVNEINEKISTINSNIEGVNNEITTIRNDITNVSGVGTIFKTLYNHNYTDIGPIPAGSEYVFTIPYGDIMNSINDTSGEFEFLFALDAFTYTNKVLVRSINFSNNSFQVTFLNVSTEDNFTALAFRPIFVKKGVWQHP